MITLITGLPGNAKTLFTLCFVKDMADKNPSRQVYYSGIRNLSLPWVNIGGYEKQEDGTTREVIPDGAPVKGGLEWYLLPTGSIVVLDECQNYFRVRGQGQAVPRAVQEFETHRHRGIDIFLITQHPMLIDTNVRRLVERHFHCMRWFGLERSTVHEFNGVKLEVDKSRNGSVRHEFKFPREAYKWYRSAEVHTVKSRVPKRVFFIAAIPVLLCALGYVLYDRMFKYASGAGAAERIQGKDAPGQNVRPAGKGGNGSAPAVVLTSAEYIAAFKPRIEGLAHTAPVFDEVMKPAQAPTPAACIASVNSCKCYTEQATYLPMPADVCKQIVQHGYFRYWALPQPAQDRSQQAGAAPAKVEAVPVAPVAPAAVPAAPDVPMVPPEVQRVGVAKVQRQ